MNIPAVQLGRRFVDLSHPTPDVEWIEPNIAARGMLTILSGPGGTGKTSLLLQIAADYSDDYFGRAAVISAENVGALQILAGAMGIDSLAVFDGAGLDLSREGDRVGLVIELLEAGGVDLLILDSLVTFAPSCDTNSGTDMSRYIDGLQKMAEIMKTAIVVIHHFNRSGSSSGSHAIRDRADFTLDLTSTAEPDLLRVTPDKWRLGRRPSPWHVHRIGPEHERDVLRYERAAARQSVVRSLAKQLSELRPDGPKRLSEIGHALGLDTTSDTNSKKLRRALDQLIADGQWVKLERGLYEPAEQPGAV